MSDSNSNNDNSLVRNTLAVVGLIYLVAKGIQSFNKHVKGPLEKKLTEVFDDESEAAGRWKEAQKTKWNGNVEATAKAIHDKVRDSALNAGCTEAQADTVAAEAQVGVTSAGFAK